MQGTTAGSGRLVIVGGSPGWLHLEVVATGEHFEMFLILATAARAFQQALGLVLYDTPRT